MHVNPFFTDQVSTAKRGGAPSTRRPVKGSKGNKLIQMNLLPLHLTLHTMLMLKTIRKWLYGSALSNFEMENVFKYMVSSLNRPET